MFLGRGEGVSGCRTGVWKEERRKRWEREGRGVKSKERRGWDLRGDFAVPETREAVGI